ncbi:MAG: phospholipase C, phosphocholine-specific [Pseudomonadota bacterium]
MSDATRRRFLQMAAGAGAGAAGMLPGLIERAAAIAANSPTGTIRDVEHVVIFMQENRSFDHYFGSYNGVRGLGDPRPLRLPGGRSVWAQPSAQHPDGFVLPFHGDSTTTQSFRVDGSEQGHQHNLTIFNRGRCDRWGATRQLHQRMLHYGAGDLPFYYALANAFTICDAYHASTLTQTYPNRLHLFTGCNGGGTVGGDPEMDNYGEDETPSADMATDQPLRPDAYRWTTYAERLEQAGVSWKVYQEYDNFGDNTLSVFPAFRPCARDSALYRRGRSWVSEHKIGADRTRSDGEQLVEGFRRDLAAGTLPQVSWIVTAADLSEHPTAVPARGEHLCAELIAALVDHPEVFAKTVFIVNYDESGGFYDHMPSPVPPVGHVAGHSTVSIAGEAKHYASGDNPGAQPIGLGIRVPALLVSPWSRGGFVCSELFDHTSVLRFLEARFGVAEPNIGPWRRAVCGDLISAFDFAHPNRDWASLTLPGTADFEQRIARSQAGRATAIPAVQRAARQMSGQRPARALPYRLDILGRVDADRRFRLDLINRGTTGSVLTVHDNLDRGGPWHYTIGAGDHYASTQWHDDGTVTDRYDLSVIGPDGLLRRYAGTLADTAEVGMVALPSQDAVELLLANPGTAPRRYTITLDPAYPTVAARTRDLTVPAGATLRDRWDLAASDRWYDLTIRSPDDPAFLRRFAGKVENGRPGRTDPAIGEMRLYV